jgi:pyruvate kinase
MTTNNQSKTQIVATIGPASGSEPTLEKLATEGMDVARLNFSWGELDEHKDYIQNIKQVATRREKQIPIIQDLPGPRKQTDSGHEMRENSSVLTEQDKELLSFGLSMDVDYIAVSFVRNAQDVRRAQTLAKDTPIIAKIEREEALQNLSEIINHADGVMVARGDLGNDVPIEELPFLEEEIIARANKAKVPVITATEMLASMTDSKTPTRAEVTDVAWAARLGSDAVMLSEETAIGNYPIDAVRVMEQIITFAEKYQTSKTTLHNL